MSDPKRATLITVGATKNVKNNVNKTVRLTINLDESNESKYPELNYKELVIAASRKKKPVNGKTEGLDPFSDNDDDVERVARKFEQKYGGKSTYGRKGRSKYDEFADIGAGYDENDSFIDNTDGYDEMMPPECDTAYGGFYINSGSLEFKLVPEKQAAAADGDDRRNKRARSSSSSEDASSASSSDSDSRDAKDAEVIANGDHDSHKTEHRKKKNKNIDKKKPKKIRRTDSSAATSGKQTSDDNAHGDGESGDSRTSQSDSLTSKPALSSENPITSDSSRDTEVKVEVKLPAPLSQLLEELEAKSWQSKENHKDADTIVDQYAVRLERTLNKCGADKSVRRVAWGRASRALHVPRARLLQRSRAADAGAAVAPTAPTLQTTTCSISSSVTTVTTTTTAGSTVNKASSTTSAPPIITKANAAATSATTIRASSATTSATTIRASCATTTQATTNKSSSTTTTSSTTTKSNSTTTVPSKRKAENTMKDLNVDSMTPEQKEQKTVELLKKLKEVIEERRPAMMAAYNAECERVQEERKKIQIAQTTEGGPHVDKRLPKRRFPWCTRSRALLAGLARLAEHPAAAAAMLQARALPLFPAGFVRMPTLLRQADLSKDIKASDVKSQRGPQGAYPTSNTQQFAEPIQFPSSLTVITTVKSAEKGKADDKDTKNDNNNPFGTVVNSYTLNKDLIIEKPDEKKKDILEKVREDYIPHNNIGSLTITPVPTGQQRTEKKVNNSNEKSKEPLLRVKSPAALNEMVNKKDKQKKDKNYTNTKEKRFDVPLHVETGSQNKKDTTQSPKTREEISQKLIENMRIQENNIPRPTLVAVNHSPTFAKPDKRPPEVRKKKEVLIVSDLDPLADIMSEPVALDDSSSDVEVIEVKSDNSEPRNENKSDNVPLKDNVSDNVSNKKVNSVKDMEWEQLKTAEEDIQTLVRNLREMEHSQEPSQLNCSAFGGVVSNAKMQSSKFNQPIFKPRSDKDKLLTEFRVAPT